MSVSKIFLDLQARVKELAFGSPSHKGLLTVHKGTASASEIVVDVKGSQLIEGDLHVTGSINSASIAADLSALVPITTTVNGHALSSNVVVTKGDVGLGNVENSAISTFIGSSNITTLGTISTGVWHGTALADAQISSASVWNAKQSAISTGTTGQYFRGDLSLASFPTAISSFSNDSAFITKASLSNTSPITYNSSTGAIGIQTASTSQAGALSSSDWNLFNGKQAALGYTPLNASSNLSDLVSASSARTALGLGSLATQSGTFSGTSSGNNSGDQTLPVKNTGSEINTGTDDTKFATAKSITDSNVAFLSDITGTNSGVNTGDQDLSGLLVKSANLTDLTSASTARTSLGLGSLATQSGTFSGSSSGTNTGDQDLSSYVPTSRTVAGHALSSDVSISASDVGLGSVTNAAQIPLSYLDTDTSLATNSDTKVASQKATKAYVDANIGGGVSYPLSSTIWPDQFVVTSTGTPHVVSLSGQKYNVRLYIDPANNGDSYSATFYMAAGSYTLSLLCYNEADGGKIDWSIDTVYQCTTDVYNSSEALNVTRTGSVTILTNGNHTLTGTINGKNAGSSGYWTYITKVWIQ